jgi:hypothetical protein
MVVALPGAIFHPAPSSRTRVETWTLASCASSRCSISKRTLAAMISTELGKTLIPPDLRGKVAWWVRVVENSVRRSANWISCWSWL